MINEFEVASKNDSSREMHEDVCGTAHPGLTGVSADNQGSAEGMDAVGPVCARQDLPIPTGRIRAFPESRG